MSHDLSGRERSFALNQSNWDANVDSHMASTFYDVEGFRQGRDTLGPIEAREIGEISGKRIAHLQCHFGLDSLSLARRGGRVTGLDFSAAAIRAARRLAEESAIDATFVQGNVYDAPNLLEPAQWDLVYTTWGTITWLPDISAWARVVAELLAPGGHLYFLDSQPIASALHQVDPTAPIEPTYDYFHGAVPLEFEEEGSYATEEIRFNQTRTHEWIHPMGNMLTALIDAGLRLTVVREHDCIAWQLFPSMVCGPDRMWRLPRIYPGSPSPFQWRPRSPRIEVPQLVEKDEDEPDVAQAEASDVKATGTFGPGSRRWGFTTRRRFSFRANSCSLPGACFRPGYRPYLGGCPGRSQADGRRTNRLHRRCLRLAA